MALETALTADDPGSSYPGYDPDEPTIENEKLAWWLRKQFYNMAQANFLWQQTDMNATIDIVNTWIDNLIVVLTDWFDACGAAITFGNPLPGPPNIPTFGFATPTSPIQVILMNTLSCFLRMITYAMYQFFTGKFGNSGYFGKGQYDNTVADMYEADVMAVQAWLDAAIAAKLAGNPIPAKPVLSTPDDYKGMLSGNQLILNTQNNIRLRINIGLLDGELKGAVGMDSGDLSELIDKLDEAMMIDGVPILEALAAVGLHITLADGTAHIEYGDEP